MVREAGETVVAPVRNAAADLIPPRFVELVHAVRKLAGARDQSSSPKDIEPAVHKVRVAARRVGVALSALKDCCGEEEWARARKLVRRIRRGAGGLRDADVHADLLSALKGREQPGSAKALKHVLARVREDRARGERDLWSVVVPGLAKRLRRVGEELIGSISDCREGVAWVAAAEFARTAGDVLRLSGQRIEEPAHLHELRLAIKRLRYTIEVFSTYTGDAERTVLMPLLEEGQKQAGEVNDILALVRRLAEYAKDAASDADSDKTIVPAIEELRDRFAGVGDRRCERFAAWWRESGVEGLLAPLRTKRDAAQELDPDRLEQQRVERGAMGEAVVVESMAPDRGLGALENGSTAPGPSQRSLWLSGHRLAVIDIGSNSIRLLAVELIDERSWRPLAEERAMTRLAHSMDRGLLCAEAMARSVEAIGRFKIIAEKLGVTNIKAFATAAVREAENKADFISLTEDRTGLKVEVVSALDEGKLTHRSVSRVYDLGQGTAAVVDIGGGSMEVVCSSNGVITENDSMPLGAVRVTERFGGANQCSGPRFKKMRRWVSEQVARHVRRHTKPPTLMVGCGGAFTTLLTLAAASRGVLIDRNSTALVSLGPVGRAQLKTLIDDLRAMTLEQRLRVPGLPSDRADIIVAGLVAIERLMKHLGVSQVHVHPGGFREGLLLRMIDQEIEERARGGVEPTDADLVGAARQLAVRGGYDRAHSEHVAKLALSLFDQFKDESDLIAGLGSVRGERLLLEAAAVLHDVGLMVEYKKHHKHSQTIIRHADLPGWSARQIELLACVARYHRRALPSADHPEFEALGEAERALVSRVAAILRVADGLDRSHSQSVQGARVRFGNGAVQIEIRAAAEPTADLKAARKKADLLRQVANVEVALALGGGVQAPPGRAGAGAGVGVATA